MIFTKRGKLQIHINKAETLPKNSGAVFSKRNFSEWTHKSKNIAAQVTK
jgi:hypothetical protein